MAYVIFIIAIILICLSVRINSTEKPIAFGVVVAAAITVMLLGATLTSNHDEFTEILFESKETHSIVEYKQYFSSEGNRIEIHTSDEMIVNIATNKDKVYVSILDGKATELQIVKRQKFDLVFLFKFEETEYYIL